MKCRLSVQRQGRKESEAQKGIILEERTAVKVYR